MNFFKMNCAVYVGLMGLLVGVVACGDDSEESGNKGSTPSQTADKGGPDSLVGYTWQADLAAANGVDFDFRFEFSDTKVVASNTCNGRITATVESPVRYLYTATVSSPNSAETQEGMNTCSSAIGQGTFDFEIVENKLLMTFDGQMVEFSPQGASGGLYGNWTVQAPGIGTLVWSMGGGKITATSNCDNGLSATTEVSAQFINKLEILEDAQTVVEDDFGLECSVAINKGVFPYRFEGDDFILTTDGQEMRFQAN